MTITAPATTHATTPTRTPQNPFGIKFRNVSPERVALNTRIHATGGRLALARMAANPEARAARIRRLREIGVRVRNAGTLPPILRRYAAPGTIEKLAAELTELESQRAAMHEREQSSFPANVIAATFRNEPGGNPRHPSRALGRVA